MKVADGAWADGAAAEAGEKIVEGAICSAPLALLDDRLAPVLAEVADVVEADPHRVLGLNRQG